MLLPKKGNLKSLNLIETASSSLMDNTFERFGLSGNFSIDDEVWQTL